MAPRSAQSGNARGRTLASVGAGLALAGATAVTAAAGFAATPMGAARLDGSGPVAPPQPTHQARVVGLDRLGGDLKRSVRVTRRSGRNRSAQRQSWAGIALILTKQSVPVTAIVA